MVPNDAEMDTIVKIKSAHPAMAASIMQEPSPRAKMSSHNERPATGQQQLPINKIELETAVNRTWRRLQLHQNDAQTQGISNNHITQSERI